MSSPSPQPYNHAEYLNINYRHGNGNPPSPSFRFARKRQLIIGLHSFRSVGKGVCPGPPFWNERTSGRIQGSLTSPSLLFRFFKFNGGAAPPSRNVFRSFFESLCSWFTFNSQFPGKNSRSDDFWFDNSVHFVSDDCLGRSVNVGRFEKFLFFFLRKERIIGKNINPVPGKLIKISIFLSVLILILSL